MNKIEFGDCRETMRKWAADGIKAQTCVTSPPYFGLRDYGHDEQIGLEETPDEYIKAMVEVFRCVWDVLEDDGTLWLNIGDSYAGNNSRASNNGRAGFGNPREKVVNRTGEGLKTKDLIGIPWMLAFALRADGWYLRQDIIWHKPNPMPESVQDRCTKAHEYIFLMSKSQKYHFDHVAIKEPIKGDGESDEMANKRSVWTVPVKPYTGAHFAVFPTELIEPCILAGAPVGGIVLDPFMGSGTTAQVAQSLGRQYLGCELNENYKPLQKKRLSQMSLEFN
jgi:DNA modification methylase